MNRKSMSRINHAVHAVVMIFYILLSAISYLNVNAPGNVNIWWLRINFWMIVAGVLIPIILGIYCLARKPANRVRNRGRRVPWG